MRRFVLSIGAVVLTAVAAAFSPAAAGPTRPAATVSKPVPKGTDATHGSRHMTRRSGHAHVARLSRVPAPAIGDVPPRFAADAYGASATEVGAQDDIAAADADRDWAWLVGGSMGGNVMEMSGGIHH